MTNDDKIIRYKRNAVFTELEKYDCLSNDGDYMEVTEWNNGEGFDIDMVGRAFHLTHGQFRALKKLVKELNKDEL